MRTCQIDTQFVPMYRFFKAFEEKVAQSKNQAEFFVSIERHHGFNYQYQTMVFTDNAATDEENFLFAERLVKTLLWMVGGYKIQIHCPKGLFKRLEAAYKPGGLRDFDQNFMARVYEQSFEVTYIEENNKPPYHPQRINVDGRLDGARIGFDAGGSDRKVAAVLDGEVLYSEEVVWHPKLQTNPQYHYNHIKEAIMTAKSKLPRVDRLGISSAGIYIDNKIMVASLFLKVPEDRFNQDVKNMYIDIAKELDVPVIVSNDGDVAALAGGMELNKTNLLGIAMGTSEAAGYIDGDGYLLGWLNELAFVPVDIQLDAMEDEWSLDRGAGVKYHSQDGIIKLATMAGITFEDGLSPAEKLKVVQNLIENHDERAKKIYHDMGVYFGYSILYYGLFYELDHILLMGRVASGGGGDILVDVANSVLKQYQSHVIIHLPDEKSRRVGQAVAAASQ